jgi:hypothetical protein
MEESGQLHATVTILLAKETPLPLEEGAECAAQPIWTL